ncbi:hypothetical protein O181_126508 [Austropuccinia psidii MF-1]|uniref:Uncharacterized protein n=1 Tax=Austropuccinia psidii MF-1 TaxID=1389203 RepID=A0A9Q3KSK7_9BASI|nr:hypothetical protein [Austropuccinia psidii MF-1]
MILHNLNYGFTLPAREEPYFNSSTISHNVVNPSIYSPSRVPSPHYPILCCTTSSSALFHSPISSVIASSSPIPSDGSEISKNFLKLDFGLIFQHLNAEMNDLRIKMEIFLDHGPPPSSLDMAFNLICSSVMWLLHWYHQLEE